MHLVLVQSVFFGLVWLGVVIYILQSNDSQEPEYLTSPQRMLALLALTRSAADNPERVKDLIEEFDAFQRVEDWYADGDEDRLMLVLRRHGKLIYTSDPKAERLPLAPADLAVHHQVFEGIRWAQRHGQDGTTGYQIQLIRNVQHEHLQAQLLALLRTLPWVLLLVPILLAANYWTIRRALRPLNRLVSELDQKPYHDLSALRAQPPQRELKSLSSALNGWLERLRSSQQRERQFAANAAHELRTPLAAISVNTEGLAELDLPERAYPLLQGLGRASERANRLTEQLLSSLRNESLAGDAAQTQLLDLAGLLQLRLADVSLLADRRHIELELQAPPSLSVPGRQELLEAVIDNLVTNAIKYSPAGRRVTVKLSASDHEACLEVLDQGPGIPAEWRERVLERFQRLPGQSGEGAGLGLSIVHGAVLALRGRMTLEDARSGPVDQGETPGLAVRVWLPLSA